MNRMIVATSSSLIFCLIYQVLLFFKKKNKYPELCYFIQKHLNFYSADVIEDDYLEDQLYAILPVDNGMSTFTRNMRYDTKKPGPTYMIHEDEDGETSEVSTGLFFNIYRGFIDNGNGHPYYQTEIFVLYSFCKHRNIFA